MTMTLVDKVASKVGTQISANSQPSTTQVVEWLNEAYDYLRRNMSYEYFPQSQKTASSASEYVTIPTDYIKLIDVVHLSSGVEYPANMMSIQEYMDIKSGRNTYMQATSSYPISTQYAGRFYVLAGTNAASTASSKIYYISASGTTIDSNATSASENPVIDKLMIDYAVAQYSYSDEELQQWQGKVSEYGATEDVIKGSSQIRSKRPTKDERVALK